MMPFQEMVDHAKKQNVTLLHQDQQIQNLYSSTCGYFCLYFLNEMNKGVDYFDLLQVFKKIQIITKSLLKGISRN